PGIRQARSRSGGLDEARKLLEAASKADPGALESAVYLAEVEERRGHFEEAPRRLDVDKQIALKKGTDVDLQRSILLARMGEPEQALALLEHREDLSAAARRQRGRLHDRHGRYSEAWKDWREGKAQLAGRYSRNYARDEV